MAEWLKALLSKSSMRATVGRVSPACDGAHPEHDQILPSHTEFYTTTLLETNFTH